MNTCPSCNTALVKKQLQYGFVYLCPQCKGRAVNLAVIRKAGASRRFLTHLWQAARGKDTPRRRHCPHCNRRMAQVALPARGQSLTLDVCSTCASVWFDTGEFQSLPRAALNTQPERKLSPQAKEATALLRVKCLQERLQEQQSAEGPASAWQWLPALLGMPVEMDAPEVSQRPWITWILAAACVAVTAVIFAFSRDSFLSDNAGADYFKALGFIPNQWARYAGLTLITSFFMHGGILHIVGNMYFLIVFGDNVEDRLGPAKYLLLLLLAHGAGMLLHGLFSYDKSIPCIGASAGISGVIAYYAFAFPNVRLGFLWRIWYYFRWFRISARWALVLYVILQLIGVYTQVRGVSSISYLGHLGGLAVGIAAALFYKDTAKRKAAATVVEYYRTNERSR